MQNLKTQNLIVCALNQTISRLSFSEDSRDQPLTRNWICGGKINTGTNASSSISVFP